MNSRLDEPGVDEVDKAIIEQLRQDGRRPYTRIASAVGLSEAAVRQRVQRLLDARVMRIVAVTDPPTVGFARQATIGVRVDGDVRKVAEAVAAVPGVDSVACTAGSFDLLVDVVAEDDERLLSLLNDDIRPIPGVRAAETFVHLQSSKPTYHWGTR